MTDGDAVDRLASAYDFELPDYLIAQKPARSRDGSRLLVLAGDAIEHRTFRDLPEYLHAGDVLVLNETRVIAARLVGTILAEGAKTPGARAEVLLLRPADRARYDADSLRWLALAKPGRKLREGSRILFGALGTARIVRVLEDGLREIEFAIELPFEQFLAAAGTLPLPPYIHNDSADAQMRYQTIFAREPGSVAAPTASLHFTPAVFEALAAREVEIVKLVLDVGLGTFRPMHAERLDKHVMHGESYAIPQNTVETIARAKRDGRRIVAAGTTVMRALEGNAADCGTLTAGAHETSIFITPGFSFRVVDALITNFHLPRSTLLVLVSAFAGRKRILNAYAQAVQHEYRFFSFGDAMFLTREG
ncbi:MAG: tRNA preQ1(34) S-adenosylmethionine ribosyltransferase-isomerase QueA [Candidatus Eremiobacteraeota bacterium]|nr:tRNA preQ1(34) S-adenosylmethionine ribosyltransferase-isomerase QueA [Candidatus Eremiobacteraeota bacterium]